MIILFIILLVLLIMIFVPCITIVPQAKAYVIERLGAYQGTWDVGFHIKLPVIDRVAKRVNLKEQVLDGGECEEDEFEIDINDLSDDALSTIRKLLDEYLQEKQKNRQYSSMEQRPKPTRFHVHQPFCMMQEFGHLRCFVQKYFLLCA